MSRPELWIGPLPFQALELHMMHDSKHLLLYTTFSRHFFFTKKKMSQKNTGVCSQNFKNHVLTLEKFIFAKVSRNKKRSKDIFYRT